MILRQVKTDRWEDVLRQIQTYGRAAPLSLQYDIEMDCNGVGYILKVQPSHGRKIAALQALEACPGGTGLGGQEYRLIQYNAVLSALLELALYQGAGKRQSL